MKDKNVQNINTIGNVSRIFIIVFKVIAIIAVVALIIAEIAVLLIPNDAIKVDADARASIVVDYDKIPGKMMKIDVSDTSGTIFGADFNWSLKSQGKTDDGELYYLDASAKGLKWGDAKLQISFAIVTAILFLAALIVALHFGQKLAAALGKCNSPFEEDVISKMKSFGKSLIPIAVVLVLFGGLSGAGAAVAVLVVMLFVYVFNYGAQLQKESDETL